MNQAEQDKNKPPSPQLRTNQVTIFPYHRKGTQGDGGAGPAIQQLSNPNRQPAKSQRGTTTPKDRAAAPPHTIIPLYRLWVSLIRALESVSPAVRTSLGCFATVTPIAHGTGLIVAVSGSARLQIAGCYEPRNH